MMVGRIYVGGVDLGLRLLRVVWPLRQMQYQQIKRLLGFDGFDKCHTSLIGVLWRSSEHNASSWFHP